MHRNFETWLQTFRDSISNYQYYIDFPKIYPKVDAIKVELNLLNTLIGSQNIESEFDALITKYPEVLKCLPILLAVRTNEIYAMDIDGEFIYQFDKTNHPISQYKILMQKTGLFDLISNHIINNLVDYVTGVEVGLDSNGRKNRGGHLMEDLVENYIKKSGYIKQITYFKEMGINDIENKWHIDLSTLSNQGTTEKRFDFVLKTPNNICAIESNFYSSSGSKLNETARSYKNLAIESQKIPQFKFIWITDGKGWHNAKNNLRETFEVLNDIYNIHDLENGIIKKF